jgi:hypothetical protein
MVRQIPRSRSVLAVGLAGIVSLGLALSACSPVTTDKPYAASDGIRATVGDLVVENVMLVTSADGEPGRLLGAATNNSPDDDTLSLSTEDSLVDIDVALGGNSTLNFYTSEDPGSFIDAVPAAPGATLPMVLSDGDGQTVSVSVPVLDGTLPEYADVLDSLPES